MNLSLVDIPIEALKTDSLIAKGVTLKLLRLDKIHPVVSGNKFFKLHYYAEACLKTSHKTILSFGGAYSNHLAATAFYCKEKGIKSIGIVRGEEPKMFSHTLIDCKRNGMQLHFINRADYKLAQQDYLMEKLHEMFGEFTMVPEGGFGNTGALGAAMIMQQLVNENATHICTSVGTATTLAGLVLNCKENQQLVAVPALKNMIDIETRLDQLTNHIKRKAITVFNEYHFGGYAKYNTELIDFMNDFYSKHHIPLDFVYTAKMMYAIIDKIEKGAFKHGSNIICLHTGGLQGNNSLPKGTLIF